MGMIYGLFLATDLSEKRWAIWNELTEKFSDIMQLFIDLYRQ